jgi:hypothetical protein
LLEALQNEVVIMDELFRFFVLRPADATAPEDDRKIDWRVHGDSPAGAQRGGAEYLKGSDALKSVFELKQFSLAQAVAARFADGWAEPSEVREIVKRVTGHATDVVIAQDDFRTDEGRLEKTLTAAKLVSGVGSGDIRGLTHMLQIYDAIRRAAVSHQKLQLRAIVIDALARTDDNPKEPSAPPRAPTSKDPNLPLEEKIGRIDEAIKHFRGLTAESFHVEAPPAEAQRNAAREPKQDASTKLAATPNAPRGWALSADAIAKIPDSVRTTLQAEDLDPKSRGLPVIMQTLSSERNALNLALTLESEKVVKVAIGNKLFKAGDEWVGKPASAMPSGHGNIKPVGIGDLLMVKEHVLRYEGGELAHVENVLKSEHLSRDTRRLERTETTVFEESEVTKEEERDNQTTDRFSLKRETSSTIKNDTEFKAGVSVDAKYGPFVEVKANADFSTHSSSEESTKQATEFSKDVVARSVSKVTERVLQRRSTTTVSEFEEKYSHGFDNTTGTGNISGVYQWVDKVSQAQVYNYGKRMLFDILVPEPATMFFYAKSSKKGGGEPLEEPIPFTLKADQISEGNYTYYASLYDVGGLEAPPEQFKTISKGFDAVIPEGNHLSSKSQDLTIDEGYRAVYALFQRSYAYYNDSWWTVLIGSNFINAEGTVGYVDMSGEIGSVSIAYQAKQIDEIAATIEIFCERTDRAMTVWKLKTHAAILQGYLAKKQAYETALAELAAQAGTVITGQNPLANARTVTGELRKQALALLTAQQFTAFGALELSAEGYPQPNLARSDQQMPYVRFFEQAFEWEHLVYFFYPYFWGWKPAWLTRMLLDDVDPAFGDFLRAGAARLVFPVRPGFEAAVIHYLETGEIWSGGPPPDITSPLYVSIIKEIQEAQGAPGDEVPVGDSWLVRTPTTLVKLRPDDELPSWQKVGEDWQPAP